MTLLIAGMSLVLVGCSDAATESTTTNSNVGTSNTVVENETVNDDDTIEQEDEVSAAVEVESDDSVQVVEEEEDESVTAITDDSTEGAEKAEEVAATPEVKSFAVTATQFEFSPSTITVNKGDTVRLTVTSEDVAHGLAIAEFGVSETVAKGETKTFEFVADKAGRFSFFCNVFCGSGHGEMKGVLVVN